MKNNFSFFKTNFNKSKFKLDLFWNYCSLVILAISGLSLNLLISFYYDASILGAFNQVLASYIVFSMLGSGGINYSVLQAVSKNSNNRSEIMNIICGAMLPTFLISLFVTFIYVFLIGPISSLLGSIEVRSGMRLIAPGIFFFSLNKVLLSGVINGLQRMKAYAFYQSIRYVFILIGVFTSILYSLPGKSLPVIFSISEMILFIFLILDISSMFNWWSAQDWTYWSKFHLKYGSKCFLSGILLELNSRIDILMLGIFLSDYQVGIYSFAAFLAEGFFQILVVLQNNYNPIISKLIFSKNFDTLLLKIKIGRRNTYFLIFTLGLFLILGYPILIKNFINFEYMQSYWPFTILIMGIILSSGYIPFQNILSMANLPGWHTIFISSIISLNIILNFIFIPLFGIYGAALSTSCSLIFSCFVLRVMVRKLLFLKF